MKWSYVIIPMQQGWHHYTDQTQPDVLMKLLILILYYTYFKWLVRITHKLQHKCIQYAFQFNVLNVSLPNTPIWCYRMEYSEWQIAKCIEWNARIDFHFFMGTRKCVFNPKLVDTALNKHFTNVMVWELIDVHLYRGAESIVKTL